LTIGGDLVPRILLFCHAIGKWLSSTQRNNAPAVVTVKIQQEEAMLTTALVRRLGLLGVSLAALALSQGVRAEDGPDHAAQNAADHIKTASPIKHVIIIVGENRSFDHLFATYVPK
jgi:phospholipase C